MLTPIAAVIWEQMVELPDWLLNLVGKLAIQNEMYRLQLLACMNPKLPTDAVTGTIEPT